MDSQFAEIRKAHAHFVNLGFFFTSTASLKCAIQLGIPDAIHNHGNAMTLSELTEALPVNPSKAPYIQRLMRVLVSAGYFSEEEPNVYALTHLSRSLVTSEPMCLRPFVLFLFETADVKAWNAMTQWFQNEDETTFETAHEMKYWEFCSQDKYGKNFDELMAIDSQLLSKLLIPDYKFLFDGLTSMVDVGGGTGRVSKAIAKTFPGLKCTVFDLPHVVANLEPTENLDFVAGDMFEKIPSAHAIFLKWVLHDWKNEDCVKILKNCKKAIPEKEKGGKVIILDIVLMEDQKHHNELVKAQLSMDMEMMIYFGTKERTEKEWASLIEEAGFSGYKMFPMIDFRSIIEVYP